jgi:CrcB protein
VSAVWTCLLWGGVLLGGGTGAVLRFLLDGAVTTRLSGGFPFGTLLVNLSGAFILGLLDGLVLPKDLALLIGTGVIGSYTTFSTWMLESQRLGEERQGRYAVVNLGLSLAGGLLLGGFGLWMGGRL